ncbi:thioredoxin family protein [Helicobacter mustelae]|uniref:Putative thioredoxin, TrxA n=1 Tax=Helicobacter mustelae (strain ATCC 43772 / CCUG 25715 / CIP 103759 / LMG 18044 / NCTC 12198 / R85-136P) TaxID=679897 RepID=D3UJI6_HELM1|nr:thioredoxin family protein [Helicobacter mustelae]CBG40662.1 putative thioredoxin, TrxA [Helicobacter mustelae 12198]SQH72159.1 thioredoxin TrxA [Helicobacter mustelae]
MQNITEKEYGQVTKEGLVVVEFGASWCPDCVRIEPIMQALSKEYEGKVKFYKVNFDDAESLKETLNIRRIPTLLFFKNGVEVGERLIEPGNRLVIENAIKALF